MKRNIRLDGVDFPSGEDALRAHKLKTWGALYEALRAIHKDLTITSRAEQLSQRVFDQVETALAAAEKGLEP